MTMPQKNSVQGNVWSAVLIAAAFVLLGHVIWKNKELIHEILSRRLDVRLFALAFCMSLGATLLTFVRWLGLVRVVEPSFRLGAAVLLGYIGNLFNLVIPGGVGGDVIKAAYLAKMDVKRTQAIASMVIDRLIGLLGLFILAAFAGGFAWPYATTAIRRLILIVWVGVALGVLGLIAIFSQSTRYSPKLTRGRRRIATIASELIVMSATYKTRLGVVAASIALSVLSQGIFTISFYLVSRMLFPAEVPSLGQHLFLGPLVFFTMAVPLPFGA